MLSLFAEACAGRVPPHERSLMVYMVAGAIAHRVKILLEKFVVRQSRVGRGPLFGVQELPWLEDVVKEAMKLVPEVKLVLAGGAFVPPVSEVYADAARISATKAWRAYFLCSYGHWSNQNLKTFPSAQGVLRIVPGLLSALISILEPESEIVPHVGPWAGQLRVHIPLVVPSNGKQSRLVVDGTSLPWVVGESIAFDDTYLHSAFNGAKCPRVVLLLTVKRPCRPTGAVVNELVLWLYRHSAHTKRVSQRLQRMDK